MSIGEKGGTHKPLPHCKAVLLCEDVHVDEVTDRFHLHGLINTLRVAEFPAEVPPLAVFLQLYDGIGRYELSVELRNLANDRSVATGIFTHLDFPERLVKMEVVVPVASLRLPHSGRYEIAILFDGEELATQFLDAEIANDGETR